MNNSKLILKTLLNKLKSEKDFDCIIIKELSRNRYSSADITLFDKDGNSEVYRIAVLKHNYQKKSYEKKKANRN